ncbi:MAG: S-layer homology domain-containing protein [Peptococcaceae bacterium]
MVFGIILLLGTIGYYKEKNNSSIKSTNHNPLKIKVEAKLKTFNGEGTLPNLIENKRTGEPTSFGKNITVNVIVADGKDKTKISQEIKKLGGEILRGEKEKGVILRAKIPVAVLKKLAASSQVVRIEPHIAPQFLNDRATGIIGAEPLAAPGFISITGLTGTNQVVGLADSGLGRGKWEDIPEDLKSKPGEKPKVIMLKSLAGRPQPDDPVGHGTHMAATIAGTGLASQGKFTGLAPAASLYFQGILNKKGEIDPPADITALYLPAFEANTYLYVNGWGSQSNAYLSNAAQTDAFMRRHPDFLVIFGAGNKGPAAGTITAEANSKNALVIGATENVRPAFGFDNDNANELARFSSRGPTADGRLKPDLVVPGAGIVSACPPLVSSNFSAFPQYTRLSGTSMAAAVGGGAAALLREYLQKEEKIVLPTAALLKALLINGAAQLTVTEAGFGRLDLVSTILALKEKTFRYLEEKDGLAEGEIKTYTFELKENNTYPNRYQRPFKATLAWTDPPGTPGNKKVLVNDLDLVVVTPDGKKCLGNDAGQGKRDEKNNVEQVFIPEPVPGVYTVMVRAARVTQKGYRGADLRQDFALVYGQKLAQDTVKEVDPWLKKVKLTRGETISLPQEGKNALGKKLTPWGSNYILPGEEVFWGEEGLYLQGKIWRVQAAERVTLSKGPLFLEADSKRWEGGYYLALDAPAPFWINGEKAGGASVFPTGAELFASVNPITQTLWLAKASFEEAESFIREVNLAKNQLFLINQEEPYFLASEAVVSIEDTVQEGSPADLPFGLPVSGEAGQLAPGMAVKLKLSPANKEVSYVAVKRNLAVGTLLAVDERSSEISLADSQKYRLLSSRLPVWLNNQAVDLTGLAPGDLVGLLLSGQQVITVMAYHQAVYGQIVYFNEERGNIYLIDSQNQFRLLKITSETKIYRWSRLVNSSSLQSGDWVRFIGQSEKNENSEEEIISRLDVAEGESFLPGELVSFNQETKEMSFKITENEPGNSLALENDVSNYTTQNNRLLVKGLVTGQTLITKNGFPVQAEDLIAGEEVEFVRLKIPGQQYQVMAAVKASSKTGVKPPVLQVNVRSLGQAIQISGYTNASKLYLYVPGEARATIIPDSKGQFLVTRESPIVKTFQVVAVHEREGGVTGEYLTVLPKRTFFADLKGHWAEKEINTLAEKGLLYGYPNGNFLPDQPVNRAEFTVMLMRYFQEPTNSSISTSPSTSSKPFVDSLPSWAEKEILRAWQAKIITGYPDGCFYPDRLINRLNAAVILARTKNEPVINLEAKDLSYRDKNKIPFWALAQVTFVTQTGLLQGFPDGYFIPLANLTRAQAAVIIFRLAKL